MDWRLISIPGAIALGACAAGVGNLQIRPIPASAAQAAQPVPERIAGARGQLALGNVALALEMFRKAEREMPGHREALAGMAECYERMGRFDLARRYLERALAASPRDSGLLQALAGLLERQGLHGEAMALRLEVHARIKPAASVTMVLPPARPVEAESKEPALLLPPPVAAVADTPSHVEPIAPSGDRLDHSLAERPMLPRVRLERTGPAEVALVTSGRSPLSRPVDQSSARRPSAPSAVTVRLLNAARRQGLAARTRQLLRESGWKTIRIGDASRVRERSLVLFSNENRETAQRIAKQLGIGLARDPRPGNVTVLLGRDAPPAAKQRAT